MGQAAVVGVVLAAGSTRAERPEPPHGRDWERRVTAAVQALKDGGCDRVLVVLGPGSGELLDAPEDVTAVRVSGRTPIAAALDALPEADSAVLLPLPRRAPPAEVVARVLDAAPERSDLARAVYAGAPGSPVALGRDHWAAFRDALRTGEGGSRYVEEHQATHVECGDLVPDADADVDRRRPFRTAGWTDADR